MKRIRFLAPLFISILYSSLHGQTVISDSTFNPEDWSVSVVSEFGANETHEQHLAGGNPGAFRYMKHVLPRPPGDNDLARVEVTHIYEGDPYLTVIENIDHIDYAEDFRLLNLSWEQAFIVSYPVLRQSGKLYRASEFLSVIADTSWQSGLIAGLKASDFTAIDGSGEHPDFTSGSDFIYFGFWRVSTRSGLLPSIPAVQDLVYEHGIDNFTVTIHTTPARNTAPVARADDYLYLDYYVNAPRGLPVTENDSDIDGDPIRIASVEEPAFGGKIVSFNDQTITYSVENPLLLEPEFDFFTYTITDGQDLSSPSFVRIHFCVCPIECMVLFLAPQGEVHRQARGKIAARADKADSLDVDLFRQFRDDVLMPSETGTGLVNFYYQTAQEIMPLLVFDRPDIGLRAMTALEMFQEPLRSLLDGTGDAFVSQVLADTVSTFLDILMTSVSDSLRDSLSMELAKLGSVQDLVGLPLSEALERTIGDSATTRAGANPGPNPDSFALWHSYPNPFNPATRIRFNVPGGADVTIQVFDIRGRMVRTLAHEVFAPGQHEVVWDASDEMGRQVSAGIYFCHFIARGNTNDVFSVSRKLIYVK